MRFYLGTHQTVWLERTTLPLFISQKRLEMRKSLPRALSAWALDSGGFSQLLLYAGWPTGSGRIYSEHVRRYTQEIGMLEWAAPQDWMCEPFMMEKTGLSLAEHQRRTVANYLTLRSLDDALPFIPVLQGYERDDYLRCIDLYHAHGVHLTGRVGIGTVCRRQGTKDAECIVRSVRDALPAVRLHVFGAKITGLRKYADALGSADSMAWSYDARRNPPMSGHSHRNCANCLDFAAGWHERVLRMSAVVQSPLFGVCDSPVSLSGRQADGVRRSWAVAS